MNCWFLKLLKLAVKKEEQGIFSQVEYRQLENEVLIFLVDNFAMSDAYESHDKLSSILDYIALNCTDEISLNDISAHFGLPHSIFHDFLKKR